ncbi:MAG: hypothetical protein RSD49_20640 [Hafnia sp.]
MSQKERALELISLIGFECQSDPMLYANGEFRENQAAIESSLSMLRRSVTGEILHDAVNPAYQNYAEAVTKLLILSADEPVIFHGMFAQVFGGKTALNTIAGLTQLTTFIWLVADDHDYRLDTSTGLPVVHRSDDYLLQAITPDSLYRALSKLC